MSDDEKDNFEKKIQLIVQAQKRRRIAVQAMSKGYTRTHLNDAVVDIDFLLNYAALMGRLLNEQKAVHIEAVNVEALPETETP